MKLTQTRFGKLIAVLALGVVVCLSGFGQEPGSKNQSQPKPEVAITVIPPSGEGGPDRTEPIAGTVKGVDLRAHRVVVYTFAGNQWWVQPTVASPKTAINSKGEWETDTHLGRQYAALLVTVAFKPKAVSSELPEVGQDVLAIDTVAGRKER